MVIPNKLLLPTIGQTENSMNMSRHNRLSVCPSAFANTMRGRLIKGAPLFLVDHCETFVIWSTPWSDYSYVIENLTVTWNR